MDKNTIDKKVQLKLFGIKKLKQFLLKKEIFFSSIIYSIFISLLSIAILIFGFEIPSIFGFISYFVYILNQEETFSQLHWTLSLKNLLFKPFLKKYLKKEYNMTIEDYEQLLRNEKNINFYKYSCDATLDNYKEYLYYWSQINILSNDFKLKEIASEQIELISYNIKNINEKIERYNKKQKDVNNILIEEGIIEKEIKTKPIGIIKI